LSLEFAHFVRPEDRISASSWKRVARMLRSSQEFSKIPSLREKDSNSELRTAGQKKEERK
jgi:hypothetical protein